MVKTYVFETYESVKAKMITKIMLGPMGLKVEPESKIYKDIIQPLQNHIYSNPIQASLPAHSTPHKRMGCILMGHSQKSSQNKRKFVSLSQD